MDKVLVIGGSGFMGSHVADKLSDAGFSVTIFDSKPSPWLRKDQKMIVGDVLDQVAVNSAAKGSKHLYHFAGLADIGEAKENPVETIRLNVMGLSISLQAAVEAKIERFVYASTMYVYSTYGSFYKASKQAAEAIIIAYNESYGLDYNFLRYGSLYGPRAQDWNGLRSYVQQIVRNSSLKYSGSGEERREYIHVEDAARLSVDILDENYNNQAIIVTGQEVLYFKELAKMIFEIVGVNEDIVYSDKNYRSDHYIMTPYQYTPGVAKKIMPQEFIDIGQGILEIVKDLHQNPIS
jgi:UDP-glucose 4-epimerase